MAKQLSREDLVIHLRCISNDAIEYAPHSDDPRYYTTMAELLKQAIVFLQEDIKVQEKTDMSTMYKNHRFPPPIDPI